MPDAEPSSIQKVAEFLNTISSSYAEWENIFTEMSQDFAPPGEHFLKDEVMLIRLRGETLQTDKDAMAHEVIFAHILQQSAFAADWKALRDQIDSFGTYLYAIEAASYNRFQVIRRIAAIALFAKRCSNICAQIGQAEQDALDRQESQNRRQDHQQRKRS